MVMHTYLFPAQHVCPNRGRVSVAAILALLLIPLGLVRAQGTPGSNTQPLAFGPDQVIIDLNRLVWVPLKAEGVPPGPEMAVLRGDGTAAGFEVVVRLPAGYTFPNHSHTSDEHYVWLKGDFTYIAADGTATPLSGQTYISLPGGVPHALACGPEPCVFYVRYPQPFDAQVHPMPPLKK
jgi:quercetin dioxygenase-like cupin family protein